LDYPDIVDIYQADAAGLWIVGFTDAYVQFADCSDIYAVCD